MHQLVVGVVIHKAMPENPIRIIQSNGRRYEIWIRFGLIRNRGRSIDPAWAKISFASSPNAPCVALEDYWESNQLPRLTAGSRQNIPLHDLKVGNPPCNDRVLTMGLIIGGATDNIYYVPCPI